MFVDNELMPRFLPLSPHTCGRHWWLFLEVTYPLSPPDNTHTHTQPVLSPHLCLRVTRSSLPTPLQIHTHTQPSCPWLYTCTCYHFPPLSVCLTHIIITIYFMLVSRAEAARRAEFSITAMENVAWGFFFPTKSSLETVGTTTAVNVSARSIKNRTGESSCSPDPAVPESDIRLT